jgi:hypothetical protein
MMYITDHLTLPDGLDVPRLEVFVLIVACDE